MRRALWWWPVLVPLGVLAAALLLVHLLAAAALNGLSVVLGVPYLLWMAWRRPWEDS